MPRRELCTVPHLKPRMHQLLEQCHLHLLCYFQWLSSSWICQFWWGRSEDACWGTSFTDAGRFISSEGNMKTHVEDIGRYIMKTHVEEYLLPVQVDSFLVRETWGRMISHEDTCWGISFASAGRFISGEGNMKTHDEEPLSPMQVDLFLVREIRRRMLRKSFTDVGRFLVK